MSAQNQAMYETTVSSSIACPRAVSGNFRAKMHRKCFVTSKRTCTLYVTVYLPIRLQILNIGDFPKRLSALI